ncbi:MAG: triple tyrosine motif-containing protein [Bacteroidetes bacterium]|nr:triple tyrosine motif-containing protein [Bacteroidota bacterium]
MNSIKNLLLFFLLFLTFYSGLSQNNSPLVKFENISKDEGLLHSYILSMYQDSRGVIWIGSWGGLNSYDGSNMLSYNSILNKDFSNSVVFAICEQKKTMNDCLWLGTESGLFVFERAKKIFKRVTNFPATAVNCIIEDEQGILWIATSNRGLFSLNPKTMKLTQCAAFNSKGSNKSISCMVYEKPNILWVGSSDGTLHKFNCISGEYHSFKTIFNVPLTSLCVKSANLLVATKGEGLKFFNKEKETFSSIKFVQPVHQDITGIEVDKNNFIWFSTMGGGLYKIQNINVDQCVSQNFTENSANRYSISSNFIRLIFKDEAGNLWMGSSGGGISKIDFFKQRFDHFVIQLNDNNIRAVCNDEKGNIWFGIENEGLFVYNEKNRTYTNIKLGSNAKFDAKNNIKIIYRDKLSRIWVGTDDGFFMFSNANAQPLHFSLPQINFFADKVNSVIAIYCTSKNELWISVSDKGLLKYKLSEILNEKIPNYKLYQHESEKKSSIAHNVVRAMHEDAQGNLWFATNRGLNKYSYNNDNFQLCTEDVTSCIAEVKHAGSSFLWVGTFGKGAYLLNTNTFAKIDFSQSNGLCSNNINGILESNDGAVWLSTGKGLARINAMEIYALEKDGGLPYDKQKWIKNYSKNSGLQAHEFNLNSATKFNDKLLFGGPKGFNFFDPQKIVANNFVLPVLICDFKIFNRSITEDSLYKGLQPEYLKSIELDYTQNYFSIYFNEVCHTSPEEVSYEYQLEGFDADWIHANSKQNSASYTNLPYGTYVFKVRGFNADGVKSNSITQLRIVISPPFWRTIWFETLAFVLCVVLLVFAVNFITRKRSQKRNAMLEAQLEKVEKEKLQSELNYKLRELASIKIHVDKKTEKFNDVKNILLSSENKEDHTLRKAISLLEKEIGDVDNSDSFEHNFNLLHNDFLSRLTKACPALSPTDLKICAYMRMNLSNNEIAELLNITPKSLETSRTRIRKKLQLDPSVYLIQFILHF